jgi:serine phosphatase RsbU (regulator of sigma subunit)
VANCGHVPPLIVRQGNELERLETPPSHGLGGRASPKPQERSTSLVSGDRLVMVSDGVINSGDGKAGLGFDGLAEAVLRSQRATGADTVREIHRAVLDAAGGELKDDATAVCLSVL